MKLGIELELVGSEPFTVTADLRDLLEWERYARAQKWPLRAASETDPDFPQALHTARLAFTAGRRQAPELVPEDFEQFLAQISSLSIETAADDVDPTKPAAGIA